MNSELVLRIDYDGKWKQLIERQPRLFILFFLSEIYDLIDFSIPPKMMMQDVTKVTGGKKKKGDLVADIVMEVHLKTGKKQLLYIHVEVQSSWAKNFGEKMFHPFYRLRDKYKKEVTAFALFVGEGIPKPHNHYEYKFGKTRVYYEFPTYICKDQDKEVLKKSDNPFAIAVLACIYLLETKDNENYKNRLELKQELTDYILKEAGRRQLDNELAYAILDFVINMMILPNKLERQFDEYIVNNFINVDNMNTAVSQRTIELYRRIHLALHNQSVEEREEQLLKNERQAKEKERQAKEKERQAKERERQAKEALARKLEEKQRETILLLFNHVKYDIPQIAKLLKVEKEYVAKVIEGYQKKDENRGKKPR